MDDPATLVEKLKVYLEEQKKSKWKISSGFSFNYLCNVCVPTNEDEEE